MSAFILSLPSVVSAFIFVAGTIAIALGSYAVARRFLAQRGDSDRRELAASIIIRVSALHGLILALVFAEELVNVRDISVAASREAVLVTDVFYDLRRYDPDETLPARQALGNYMRHVAVDEWSSLATQRRLLDDAWREWETAYAAILALEPADGRQQALREIMISDVREVSGLRRVRENAAFAGANPLFMTAAIVGVILTAVSYFTFAPSRLNLLLISIFASYTGLIVFFIVAFSNPYRAPGMVAPIGFERAYAGEIRTLGEAGRKQPP